MNFRTNAAGVIRYRIRRWGNFWISEQPLFWCQRLGKKIHFLETSDFLKQEIFHEKQTLLNLEIKTILQKKISADRALFQTNSKQILCRSAGYPFANGYVTSESDHEIMTRDKKGHVTDFECVRKKSRLKKMKKVHPIWCSGRNLCLSGRPLKFWRFTLYLVLENFLLPQMWLTRLQRNSAFITGIMLEKWLPIRFSTIFNDIWQRTF